jgi:hypothetical protein
MIPHGVLKNFHPMLGCDWHIPWPPGAPAPLPTKAPYFVFHVMSGLYITSQYASDALSHYTGQTMLKVTDIGPMIPHLGPPSTLLAIEMPLSSSKSYFGSSRYVSKGKPVAAALLWHLNPNLNCGYPMPTPTGAVIALTTHEVDMTWGDILSGLLNMGIDFLIAWGLNKVMGKVNSPVFKYLHLKIFQRIAGPMEQRFAQEALEKGWDIGVRRAAAGVIAAVEAEAIVKAKEKGVNWAITAGLTVAGVLLGSPLGVDASTPGTYGRYSGDHPAIGASKGDHRGGPGDMAGGGATTLSDAAGHAVDKLLGDGMPNGYPKDIGDPGITN